MILLDTSVWVDHLYKSDPAVAAQLAANRVATHPFVIGEIACGRLLNRAGVMATLQALPVATMASHGEVLRFIERQALGGRGVGYIDFHLVASAMMTPNTRLWTRDKRLAAVAAELGVFHDERKGA